MKPLYEYFSDKENIRIIDLRRIIYFIIFLAFFALTEIGRNIYRPFIYQNHINDFRIADTIGNSLGIIVQIFFMLFIINSTKKKSYFVVAFLSIGYVVYEILQIVLPRKMFDINDVYATFVGGVIGLMILLIIHKLVKRNKIFYTINK